MDTSPVVDTTEEKTAQESLEGLARIIIKMYQREHPLPDFNGTLPLYDGEPPGAPE